MYVKGFQQGGAYLLGRIQNSVAALDYGPGYFVQPVVEEDLNARDVDFEAVETVVSDSRDHDAMSESTLGTVVPPEFPEEYADGIDGTLPNPIQGCT